MSDYDLRPGGSLKLKGTVADGGIVKKKKKKSKRKEGLVDQESELERQKVEKAISRDDDRSTPGSGSGRKTPAVANSDSNGTRRTEAEKRFEERQKQRMAERVAKLAGKTHKDRVNEFNAKLEALSEHHDIPKVGPG